MNTTPSDPANQSTASNPENSDPPQPPAEPAVDASSGESPRAEPSPPKDDLPVEDPAVKEGTPARFKIGSQREGETKQDARPNPVTPAAPSLVESQPDEQSNVGAPAGQEARQQSASERKPSLDRGRASFASSSNVPIQDEPLPTPSMYPPPNLRDKLSPELEAEVEAALGGVSLDSLLEDGAQEGTASVSGEQLEIESKVKGRVLSIHREDVFFDLGGRNQGLAPLKQFDEPPEIGAELEIVISRYNAADGFYEVILPGASVSVGDWSGLSEGLIVDVLVTGHNKGGLECEAGKLRGFIPAGQVSLFRIEDFEQFVGQKFACVIVEADPERRNLVLSRRAILEREQAEAREKLLAKIGPGQRYEGTVTSLQKFGAFVNIGGVEGLIHISKLCWNRIAHADKVLQLGQKVNVIVDKYDETTGKVSFEYADREESPWKSASMTYPATSLASGTVTKIMDFGAFVQLEPGIEGLVHISELSHRRVHRVSDVLSEGQQIEIQVLSIDPQAQRMSLSLKALEAAPEAKKRIGRRKRRRPSPHLKQARPRRRESNPKIFEEEPADPAAATPSG